MMDPIVHNVVWFVIWAMMTTVGGFVYTVNKTAFYIVLTSLIVGFVVLTIVVFSTSDSEEISPFPWYYYIGNVLAGALSWTFFDAGKKWGEDFKKTEKCRKVKT